MSHTWNILEDFEGTGASNAIQTIDRLEVEKGTAAPKPFGKGVEKASQPGIEWPAGHKTAGLCLSSKQPHVPHPRIPPEVAGIQVNFCKNPGCENFGIPPLAVSPPGRASARTVRDRYKIVGLDKGVPALQCKACKEMPPLKSNHGIHKELQRLSSHLTSSPPPSCSNHECANRGVSVETEGAYQRFGTTRSGSARYRCKQCWTLLSVPKATNRQKAPEKNALIFKLLVNKTVFRRLCELADISPGSLYGKIDFLYRQCQAFAGEHERRLETIPRDRLYVSVDRQDYVVNWSDRTDKRNVQLTAVGSADNDSSYVFGMDLNFVAGLDPVKVERDAVTHGDYRLPEPFRKYAHLWLKRDDLAPSRNAGERAAKMGLDAKIEGTYADALRRADVEQAEHPSPVRRLPVSGMQAHSDYTLYAHFQMLKRLFGSTEKVRFFMDKESGIRAACLAAFKERVRDATCDAYYVRINKGMTIDETRQALREVRQRFRSTQRSHPDLSENEVKLHLIKAEMRRVRKLGHWRDRWITHPLPNMSEPEKAVCWLTDHGQYDLDHQAWLYSRASLHGIDKFFMLVRRRLSLLERPIGSASSTGRTWYGYSAYNPEVIVKILTIFRVFHNYTLLGDDKKTPAMRIGLAGSRVDYKNVINYNGNVKQPHD